MLVTDLPIKYNNYACIYQLILILTNPLTKNEVIIIQSSTKKDKNCG